MLHYDNLSSLADNATGLQHELVVMYYAVGAPLSAFLIITNAIILAAFSRPPPGDSGDTGKLRLVVCNIAVADLLLGCALMIAVATAAQQPVTMDTMACTWLGLIQLIPAGAALLFLTLIHLDRFLAVCAPTMYTDAWTNHCVTAACALIWLFSLLFCALAYAFPASSGTGRSCDLLYLSPAYVILTITFHLLPTVLVNTALFLRINHTLKVHQRKIQVTNTLTYSNLVNDTQLARLYFLLVLLSIGAWTPCLVAASVWFIEDSSGTALATRITFLFGHIAGLKILVYMCESTTYRAAVKKRLSRSRGQGSRHNLRASAGVQ